jgi:hypothetical protein
MNLERVVFGFVIILALTFTFAFVMGDIDNASHHNVWLLTIAILINLIATGLKLGDRSQVGALLLASSLVVDVLLITARVIWVIDQNQTVLGPNPESMANIVSLAGGALVASFVSVVILVGDTLISRR